MGCAKSSLTFPPFSHRWVAHTFFRLLMNGGWGGTNLWLKKIIDKMPIIPSKSHLRFIFPVYFILKLIIWTFISNLSNF
jgi:hypothetical protein